MFALLDFKVLEGITLRNPFVFLNLVIKLLDKLILINFMEFLVIWKLG